MTKKEFRGRVSGHYRGSRVSTTLKEADRGPSKKEHRDLRTKEQASLPVDEAIADLICASANGFSADSFVHLILPPIDSFTRCIGCFSYARHFSVCGEFTFKRYRNKISTLKEFVSYIQHHLIPYLPKSTPRISHFVSE